MSKFEVEMQYKDHATLQVTVMADSRAEAERKAKENGAFMGFTGAVKKYVVRLEA